MFSVPRVGADLIASITVSVGLIEKWASETQRRPYAIRWLGAGL